MNSESTYRWRRQGQPDSAVSSESDTSSYDRSSSDARLDSGVRPPRCAARRWPCGTATADLPNSVRPRTHGTAASCGSRAAVCLRRLMPCTSAVASGASRDNSCRER
eukprot:260650-Chlamydomonas_euryale.AAC.1